MDDFDDFVAARWPTLVRAALLLGAPEPVAVEVAADALARLRSRWRRLSADGDLDGEVWGLVADAWDARRRRRWWLDHPARPLPEGCEHLDALEPPDRLEEVRRLLDGTQAPSGLVVATPPPDRRGLVAARRSRRRRTGRRAALPLAVLAVLVVVAGVVSVVTSTSPDPPDPDRLPRALSRVTVTTGPDTWVTWWAEDELHLGPVALAVPDVEAIVDAPDGAVYVDRAGRVVRVDSRGARLLLGHAADPTSLVTSPDHSLAGWVDTTDAARPALTVVRAVDGARRRTYALAPAVTVTVPGLRNDRIYAVVGGRTLSWRFATGAVELDQPDLRRVVDQLAVFGPERPGTSTLRVTFLDPKDTTPPPTTWVQLDGDDAALAPDGSAVLTRGVDGEVALTALSPRTSLPTGLQPREVALDAVLGPDLQVAYVVELASTQPQAATSLRGPFLGPTRLRSCTVSLARRATECRTVVELPTTGAALVLAR